MLADTQRAPMGREGSDSFVRLVGQPDEVVERANTAEEWRRARRHLANELNLTTHRLKRCQQLFEAGFLARTRILQPISQ